MLKHINAGDKLTAEAWDRDNKNKLATGTLTAIDNQVDPTTGTVKFRSGLPMMTSLFSKASSSISASSWRRWMM